MTLGFKTHIGGKPTHFVHKIWIGIDKNKSVLGDREALRAAHFFYFMPCVEKGLCYPDWNTDFPKIHTIRADEKNRWRVGMPIHFVVKNRTPQRFQFAPILPVQSIQQISVKWTGFGLMRFVGVFIDGKPISKAQTEILAKNDGFESRDDFFKYFNSDFDGKIIHWTDFTYSF